MVTDPIADLLTRIRNGVQSGHSSIVIPASRVKASILKVLQQEGYVDQIEEFKDSAGKAMHRVYLRVSELGKPIIRELTRISRPGKRVYVGSEEIPVYKGGLGLVIVSTPLGVITGSEARKSKVGGELVCSIF
jgi:small subunit ribosomal protein S8